MHNREINRRMSKRFAWLLGMAVLVLIGLLVACGSTYNSAFDGLVLVSSQGSGLLETFSFNLNSGSIFAVNNPPSDTANLTCVLNGLPSSIVVDPAGAYAYTIITANQSVCGPNSTATGIAAFKINSDGTMKAIGSLVPDPNPIQLVMDSKGRFLFVAEGPNSISTAPMAMPCPGTTQYGVCVYAIGGGGTLTAVQGTFTFALPPGAGFQPPDFAAVAVTPMVLPPVINGVQQAVCSSPGNSLPKSEFLYAADAANNVVWEFSVNTSTGALGNPPNATQVPYFPSAAIPSTGQPLAVPSGVAVDPCDRFVYVANNLQNNISAYTICNGTMTQSSSCTAPDGSLRAVAGSPFSLTGGANGPGPMTVDPFGNTLYVLDTLSNQVSILRISSQVSGSLTSSSQVQTGLGPTSLAIRSDNSWLFVANFQAGTLSQYSITPLTGALAAGPVTTTDNYPWGVAVK
jgi:6-phosphogluconolactonase (cycloisomerase 2 family)